MTTQKDNSVTPPLALSPEAAGLGFSAAASLAGSTEDQVAIASAITFIAGASITLPQVLVSAAYQWWLPAPFAIAAAISGALLLSHLLPALVRHIVHDER